MPSLNRRQFLRATGAAAAVTTAALAGPAITLVPKKAAAKKEVPPPPVATPPLVGSQLYGWGQFYEREGKKLWDHLDELYQALRDAGYDYAEAYLDVATPDENEKQAARMRQRGLKPVSLYTGGAFHVLGKASETAERIAAAAKSARKGGFHIVVCNPDPIGRPKTEAELRIQADALAELGTDLRGQGMHLALHHHTPELANRAQEFHSNFALTPAADVKFCLDTHWMYRGGLAPMDALRQYGDRVVCWHLRQSRNQVWWEDLDTGDIDYSEIAAHARQKGIPARFTVEIALEGATKVTRSGVENHARSRRFVRQVFGV